MLKGFQVRDTGVRDPVVWVFRGMILFGHSRPGRAQGRVFLMDHENECPKVVIRDTSGTEQDVLRGKFLRIQI